MHRTLTLIHNLIDFNLKHPVFVHTSSILTIFFVFSLSPVHSFTRQSYIKGTVTAENGSLPLEAVKIRIYHENWVYLSGVSTQTDPDGTYISGALDPGYYYLRALTAYPQPYVSEYWSNTWDRELAIPIRVDEGADVVGIDFELMHGGYILGLIKTTGGTPLAELDLDLYNSQWQWQTFTCRTEADGSYILGAVPPDNYFVRADPDYHHGCQQRYWQDAYYRETATFVAVHAGDEIYGIDFNLPPGSAITGEVIRSTGGPAAECEIIAYSTDWTQQPIHQAVSDETGLYTAFGLPAGNYYLQADPQNGSGCAGLYYPDCPDTSCAQPVLVEINNDTTGIDFTLPEGNFDIELLLDMPAATFHPGDTFYLNLDMKNDGPDLAGLPVFLILDAFDALYFWPGWTIYSPPDHPYIDYSIVDIPAGPFQVEVFPSFSWPYTGTNASGLTFISAVVNWSLTGLASDVATSVWGFE